MAKAGAGQSDKLGRDGDGNLRRMLAADPWQADRAGQAIDLPLR
jgi:hypothetical protein